MRVVVPNGAITRRADTLTDGYRMPEPRIDEDRVAALTLGKTIAFLLYSLPTFAPVLALELLTPLGRLNASVRGTIVLVVWLSLEWILLWFVIDGRLPGTSGDRVRPFNERQLAVGCTVVSLLVWLAPFGSQARDIIDAVVNGGLFLGVVVYFVVKSALARNLRWTVLLVGLVPAAQLIR